MFYYTQYKTQYIILTFHLVTILRNVGTSVRSFIHLLFGFVYFIG